MVSRSPDIIFSFHDLCPETMPMALELLTLLAEHGKKETTLLIIPGLFKNSASIGELKKLLRKFPGARSAGHGWSHKTVRKTTVYHYLHSKLISRDVGEHLSRSEAEIYELINSCHGWFATHDLPEPELYVPPAWAMGKISRNTIDTLPFRYYEYQSGIYDRKLKRFQYIPVIGFEADTRARQAALIIWNYFNIKISKYAGSLRVAIHPFDLELKLGSDLKELIRA